MKVAHIVNTFPAFSQTFILNQITGLIDLDITPDIYASRADDTGFIQPDVEKYDLLDRTIYYQPVRAVMPENILKRIFKALTILLAEPRDNRIILLRSLNILKYKKSALSLHTFYKAYIFLSIGIGKYDIVHAHFGPNGILAALLKDLGVIKGKVITTYYGYDVSTFIRKYGSGVYRKLFDIGDLFLVLSDEMKRELIQLGCPEEKIKIHHLGIDLNSFPYVSRNGSRQKTVKIVTVARFVEKKGLRYAIEAVARLVKKYPETEFDIIGDGPLREEFINQITMLQAEQNIHLLGWKKQDEIAIFFRDSDIFLAPSVTAESGDREGTPTVLMEALAQGLPVVSTEHSGIPEIVDDGSIGFLVPERDVDSLEKKIQILIDDPELRKEMGRRGRRKIDKEFNIKNLTGDLANIYHSLKDG